MQGAHAFSQMPQASRERPDVHQQFLSKVRGEQRVITLFVEEFATHRLLEFLTRSLDVRSRCAELDGGVGEGFFVADGAEDFKLVEGDFGQRL
jgi:hypothetical protein